MLFLWAHYHASSGHFIGNYIVLDGYSQIIEATAVAPQPSRATPCSKSSYVLLHTCVLIKDGVEVFCLSAQYQASSGQYIKKL
jgi:hypothetical protein